MPVYKSRLDIPKEQIKLPPGPLPKLSQKKGSGIISGGGLASNLTDDLLNFVDNNHNKTVDIAKKAISNIGHKGSEIENKLHGFLMKNKDKAKAIVNIGKKVISKVKKAGSLKSGGLLSKVKKGASLPSGGLLRIPKKINIRKIDRKKLTHVIGNLNSHEFNIVQGVTAKFLKMPHHLEGHIGRDIKQSLEIPKGHHKQAYMDIYNAKSPSNLARALHGENIDHENGKNVGGGLYDSIQNIYEKGLDSAKQISKGVLNVANTLNNSLEKGIIIAESLTSIVGIFDPELETTFKTGLNVIKSIHENVNNATRAGNIINSLLHQNVDGVLEELGKVGLSGESKEKLGEIVKLVSKVAEEKK